MWVIRNCSLAECACFPTVSITVNVQEVFHWSELEAMRPWIGRGQIWTRSDPARPRERKKPSHHWPIQNFHMQYITKKFICLESKVSLVQDVQLLDVPKSTNVQHVSSNTFTNHFEAFKENHWPVLQFFQFSRAVLFSTNHCCPMWSAFLVLPDVSLREAWIKTFLLQVKIVSL